MEQMEYDDRAQRGAAWLDNVRPGWEALVDVETLNICSPRSCVAGQVFAEDAASMEALVDYQYFGYDRAVDLLREQLPERWFGDLTSDHGFTPGFVPEMQEDAWRRIITARRSGVYTTLSRLGYQLTRDAYEMITDPFPEGINQQI